MLAVESPLTRASVVDGEVLLASSHSSVQARLASLKARVPAAQAKVGRRAWDELVTVSGATERTGGRQKRPVASRAYHKMREILLSCALPDPRVSVHLCEAPGGFVQAVGEYTRHADWTWTALSREDGPQPATALLPMDRGRFVQGDVFSCEGTWLLGEEEEEEEGKADVKGRLADLVTADGASWMDHGALEEEHLPLLIAQTHLALRRLAEGGVFVIKFFEGLHPGTLAWLAWTTTWFVECSVIKPTSSRPTNSERYLVARGKRGAGGSDVDVSRAVASDGWLRETRLLCERYATRQCEALEECLRRV